MKEFYAHHREKLSDVTRDLAAVAMGTKAADLLIKNGNLVNVNVGYIQENIDVAVSHGFIAYVGPNAKILTDEHTRVVDAKGRYLVPGFIDGHMHIESSMIDPRNFACGVLPNGVTTICPDNHEITNVLGMKAVKLFHDVMEDVPIKCLLAMPVCVPSLPGMEDAGAVISAEDVAAAYDHGWAQLQGEQMNFVGMIYSDPAAHAINKATLDAGVVATGHYPSHDLEQGLNAFVATGQNACHELTDKAGAIRRAELGMYAQMRYGTAGYDMPNAIKAYTDNPGIDDRFFCMVTDDVDPATVYNDGQLLRVVRTAIQQGVPPVKAIQYVTINVAQMLEKARWIGSISPAKAADILIVSDLPGMVIDEVYSDGVLVAENGRMAVNVPPYDYPEWALHSVYLDKVTPDFFKISAEGLESPCVRVMDCIPNVLEIPEVFLEMTAIDGELKADPEQDLAKIFDIYRHSPDYGVTGSHGSGFIRGIGMRANCAYASTVAHDSHNMMVVGTSDEAMAMAANALVESEGGIAIVVDGKLEAVMALPLAGLMTLESAEVAAAQVTRIEQAIAKTGCPHSKMEMTLSFAALPVLEELHITNRGYVLLKEGKAPELVPLIRR
ncbi:MAG: adenine deaminase [Anaerolineaceae bacterium]|nr:adenine deaminase [Anaerolineaceae bacterium]